MRVTRGKAVAYVHSPPEVWLAAEYRDPDEAPAMARTIERISKPDRGQLWIQLILFQIYVIVI